MKGGISKANGNQRKRADKIKLLHTYNVTARFPWRRRFLASLTNQRQPIRSKSQNRLSAARIVLRPLAKK
jgi:hypothetical protein